MARIKNEIKKKVVEMFEAGELENVIARELEISTVSVRKIIQETGASRSEEEEVCEEVDWKFWADFWKNKYLEAHAELLINQD